jgi:hypothetical protein
VSTLKLSHAELTEVSPHKNAPLTPRAGQTVWEHRLVFARFHERKSTTTVYDCSSSLDPA